jgi:phenylalanyl-tRNA synthetase alpha chain
LPARLFYVKDMKEQIDQVLDEIRAFEASGADAVEQFRIRMLGKNGLITAMFARFREMAAEEKKDTGRLLNELKNAAQDKIDQMKEAFLPETSKESVKQDLTLPGNFGHRGARHPISLVRNEIIRIFSGLGYQVAEGPEIEDDWHNFSALNFPPEHPARDMQDTFFIQTNPEIALRTHTSSVQVRTMETSKPPIRIMAPGRVYRNESISARAHVFFHQVEGLYIDQGVSFADLRQTLLYFSREMFGPETEIRLRPSYFPFTEPSAEMDISCLICKGGGCPMCKKTGWVEILGCGMVDPSVLENCGIDPEVYSGFAFGMGVERITNLKFQVKDLRLFSENDVRFLRQFDNVVW